MDRKQFLKGSFGAGFCCCAAALGIGSSPAAGTGKPGEGGQGPSAGGLSADLHKRMRAASETPDWAKVEKSERWIKNLIDNMDALLDEETKIKLMKSCGRSCYLGAFGVRDKRTPSAQDAEAFLANLEKQGFKIERGVDTITAHFGWSGEQNPMGLSLKEGYCMCPLVEREVRGLSPTYCLCSSGYVQEIFERSTGRTVKSVEVVESVKRGGKDCRFKVTLAVA
jgi:hypothetical protein